MERGLQCKYDNNDAADQAQAQAQPEPATSDNNNNNNNQTDFSNLWSPEIDQYVEAYFARFHPTWSFLHKATFSPRRELPFLVQAVVMIGLWATTQQSGAREAAIKLHEKMRVSIWEQQVSFFFFSGRRSGASQKDVKTDMICVTITKEKVGCIRVQR